MCISVQKCGNIVSEDEKQGGDTMKKYDLHIKLTEDEAFMLEFIIDEMVTTKTKIIRHMIKEYYKKLDKAGR